MERKRAASRIKRENELGATRTNFGYYTFKTVLKFVVVRNVFFHFICSHVTKSER